MVVAEEEETSTCTHGFFRFLHLRYISFKVKGFLELIAGQTMLNTEAFKNSMRVATNFDPKVHSLIFGGRDGVKILCFNLDCLLL